MTFVLFIKKNLVNILYKDYFSFNLMTKKVIVIGGGLSGIIAAANKSITGISIIGPITTSIILGGINIPRVPPAVIVPAANLTS